MKLSARIRHPFPATGFLNKTLPWMAIAWVFATVPVVVADPPAAPGPIRTTGPRSDGPVSVSLQNEVDAATDRGRAWLLATQNADGSWGTNRSARLTAVALLALAHGSSNAGTTAVHRAAQWLASPAATNAPASDLEDQAWRETALGAVLPPDPARTRTFLTTVAHAANRGSALAFMLVRDLAASAPTGSCSLVQSGRAGGSLFFVCLDAMPAARSSVSANDVLADLAAQWDDLLTEKLPSRGTSERYWVYARFINRAGGGTLADRRGRVLDWRNDLARVLVATQTLSPDRPGCGYWHTQPPSTEWASDPVAETAFALLTLDEL
jgi:hypothetical protein